VADTFGGNENDRGQVRQFVQACLGRLAREIDGAVLALAHPSRAGQGDGTGQSGSTGWDASFRSRLYLSAPSAEAHAPPDADLRVLSREKANYARRGDRIELRWTDGVLVPVESPRHGGLYTAADRQRAERVFLKLLGQTIREQRWVSHSPRAGNYAPRMFAGMPAREGCGIGDFRQAMEALFESGQILNRQYGKPSDKTYRIEPASREPPPC